MTTKELYNKWVKQLEHQKTIQRDARLVIAQQQEFWSDLLMLKAEIRIEALKEIEERTNDSSRTRA